MLIPRNASIPRTAGFTPPRENIGELSNHGIRFPVELTTQAGEFNFRIGVNGGYSKNEVVYYDEPPQHLPGKQ